MRGFAAVSICLVILSGCSSDLKRADMEAFYDAQTAALQREATPLIDQEFSASGQLIRQRITLPGQSPGVTQYSGTLDKLIGLGRSVFPVTVGGAVLYRLASRPTEVNVYEK